MRLRLPVLSHFRLPHCQGCRIPFSFLGFSPGPGSLGAECPPSLASVLYPGMHELLAHPWPLEQPGIVAECL